MTEPRGRGAWNTKGEGGTLLNKQGVPGRNYLYTTVGNGWKTVGSAAVFRFLAGQPNIPQAELAVHYGVKAIQSLLNQCVGVKTKLLVDGLFLEKTEQAVKEMQAVASLKTDGIVGPKTMQSLLFLPILNLAKKHNTDWRAVYGLLANEGGWDPGAVGFLDPRDLGLAQINLPSHPKVTVEQAFDPFFAIDFICTYLENAAVYLKTDNIRDIIVSYNLGIGGTRSWIADGRPDVWQPSWSTTLRYPNRYIDKILSASEKT